MSIFGFFKKREAAVPDSAANRKAPGVGFADILMGDNEPTDGGVKNPTGSYAGAALNDPEPLALHPVLPRFNDFIGEVDELCHAVFGLREIIAENYEIMDNEDKVEVVRVIRSLSVAMKREQQA